MAVVSCAHLFRLEVTEFIRTRFFFTYLISRIEYISDVTVMLLFSARGSLKKGFPYTSLCIEITTAVRRLFFGTRTDG